MSMRFLLALIPAACAAQTALAADPPRTAWGDPDLQGTYTSDNSIGVPFERPREFGTRAELDDAEYAARVSANDEQVAKDLNASPESEFSADDPAAINASRHWLERPVKPSRATSMIVDPPDGRLPQLTPDGRAAHRGAPRATQSRTAGVVPGFHELRPVHQPRRRGLDPARDLRQRHAGLAGAGCRRDPQRDDPRGPRDPARRQPAAGPRDQNVARCCRADASRATRS